MVWEGYRPGGAEAKFAGATERRKGSHVGHRGLVLRLSRGTTEEGNSAFARSALPEWRWWASTLRVHGVQGPRVADAAIVSTPASGNTDAPLITIDEAAFRVMLAAAA